MIFHQIKSSWQFTSGLLADGRVFEFGCRVRLLDIIISKKLKSAYNVEQTFGCSTRVNNDGDTSGARSLRLFNPYKSVDQAALGRQQTTFIPSRAQRRAPSFHVVVFFMQGYLVQWGSRFVAFPYQVIVRGGSHADRMWE